MSKIKAKILRYEAIEVDAIFDKESELLSAIQTGQLTQGLLLWRTTRDTLVLPSGNKWQESEALHAKLEQTGWHLYSRKTGGAPVPQTQGVINVSYMYALNEAEEYSIPRAYKEFCDTLSLFFEEYNVDVQAHATPGSYCDGDYNLNINGRKVVGTAQRVVLKKGGGKVVLAQACILIDVDPKRLIQPVNLCYQHHEQTDRVKAEVHTCLFEHIDSAPNTDALFHALYKSFVSSPRGRKQS